MIYIKTLYEIAKIRKSCQIVADVLRLLGLYIKPGMTTLELDTMAEDFIKSNDASPAFKGYSQAESQNYPASICASIDSCVVHGIPNKTPLLEGQILSIDVGVKKDGYYGDAAFTYPVGNVSEEKRRLMAVTKESLRLGVESAKHNNHINDISTSVEDYVVANGYSVVRDLTGHGVGKYLHEDPPIPNYKVNGKTKKLKNGMTIAIEPMVNAGIWKVNILKDGWSVMTADNLPSAHFEHTILINNDNPEILTI